MVAKYFFVLCLLVCIVEAQAQYVVFNVMNYGAKSDGQTDNSGAFLKAWYDACKWNGKSTMFIPEGTYMLNEVIFSGPCRGTTNFKLKGLLKAPIDPYSIKKDWINFRYVDNLIVGGGGGVLDGQGSYAWKTNDCRTNPNCRPLPTTMSFDFITNGYIHRMRSVNSKQGHFVMYGCQNMILTKLKIIAPSDSPNTDGIKMAKSHGINITNVNIGTGDDCIAILSGTRHLRISDVFCGPGHGISIGSLGKYEGEENLSDIHVKNCTISGASNGVRIKTWASQLKNSLVASDIVFEDIIMNNVQNPIIIDQRYCPVAPCTYKGASNVQISNVSYKYIRGSGNGEVAVSINCSEKKPCQNIKLDNINLWPSGGKGTLRNECSFVNGASYGPQNPPSCI
ncbi:exopolygalacturonase [Cicer arietinum]|uniref:Exopolygalacturonase-like n=1 Tax=Cicer arietinum TaxID=3827 RepID=A0A1S2YW25_CICAR|nr:exopolygalacturonase-like [Cicer arietinum]